MNSNTKFVQLISQLTKGLKNKFWVFQTIITVSVFALFLGFVCGNLFGTFLNYFRNFVRWDGLIISFTILTIEFINYLNFKHSEKEVTTTFELDLIVKQRSANDIMILKKKRSKMRHLKTFVKPMEVRLSSKMSH